MNQSRGHNDDINRDDLVQALQAVLEYGSRTRLMITSTRIETHEFEVAAQVLAQYVKKLLEHEENERLGP